MRQRNPLTPAQMKADYVAAKAAGSPLLKCQGMIVPRGFEEMRLFIQTCPRPTLTFTEPGQVSIANGLRLGPAGVPENLYQGPITCMETENAIALAFTEYVAANGGIIQCDYYDGRPDSFTRVFELMDCAFTFEQSDKDSDGRSEVQTISGQIQYHYFGLNAAIGQNNTILPGQRLIEGAQPLLQRAQSALNLLNQGVQLAGGIANFFG